MDVWSVMSLMWIRQCPRAFFPMKQSWEILWRFTTCAQQLMLRFSQQDEVEPAGQTAFRWSSFAGLSFDVRQTVCLIAQPCTEESVWLYFTSACRISAVTALAAGQTQAGDGIVPPFCRISHVLRQWRKRRRCCNCFSFSVLAQGQMGTPVSYCKICFTLVPVFLLMWNGKMSPEAVLLWFYSSIVNEMVTSTCIGVVRHLALNWECLLN